MTKSPSRKKENRGDVELPPMFCASDIASGKADRESRAFYKRQGIKGERLSMIMGDHSKLHPRIRLDMRRLTMTIVCSCEYVVDLERLTHSAAVLDFFLQIMGKMWADQALGGELAHALEDACRRRFGESAQGVFCPFEQGRKVNWKTKMREPI